MCKFTIRLATNLNYITIYLKLIILALTILFFLKIIECKHYIVTSKTYTQCL
jgi:hypothetical protein